MPRNIFSSVLNMEAKEIKNNTIVEFNKDVDGVVYIWIITYLIDFIEEKLADYQIL